MKPIDKPRRPYRGGHRRIWSIDGLELPRAWFHGPRWKRLCGVVEKRIADVNPPWAHLCRHTRMFVLVFSFEEEIRELVSRGCGAREEIRPGVYAQW